MRCNPIAVSYGTRSNPQFVLFRFVLFLSTSSKHCTVRVSNETGAHLGCVGAVAGGAGDSGGARAEGFAERLSVALAVPGRLRIVARSTPSSCWRANSRAQIDGR